MEIDKLMRTHHQRTVRRSFRKQGTQSSEIGHSSCPVLFILLENWTELNADTCVSMRLERWTSVFITPSRASWQAEPFAESRVCGKIYPACETNDDTYTAKNRWWYGEWELRNVPTCHSLRGGGQMPSRGAACCGIYWNGSQICHHESNHCYSRRMRSPWNGSNNALLRARRQKCCRRWPTTQHTPAEHRGAHWKQHLRLAAGL